MTCDKSWVLIDSKGLIHEWVPRSPTVNKNITFCSENIQGKDEKEEASEVEEWSVVVPPGQCPMPQVNVGDLLDR